MIVLEWSRGVLIFLLVAFFLSGLPCFLFFFFLRENYALLSSRYDSITKFSLIFVCADRWYHKSIIRRSSVAGLIVSRARLEHEHVSAVAHELQSGWHWFYVPVAPESVLDDRRQHAPEGACRRRHNSAQTDQQFPSKVTQLQQHIR